MVKKIVLIGAGSLQFGFDTMGDIFQSQVLPGSRIVLHDINPEALEKVRQVGERFVKDNNLDFEIISTNLYLYPISGQYFNNQYNLHQV